jgi:hypothetical protein
MRYCARGTSRSTSNVEKQRERVRSATKLPLTNCTCDAGMYAFINLTALTQAFVPYATVASTWNKARGTPLLQPVFDRLESFSSSEDASGSARQPRLPLTMPPALSGVSSGVEVHMPAAEGSLSDGGARVQQSVGAASAPHKPQLSPAHEASPEAEPERAGTHKHQSEAPATRTVDAQAVAPTVTGSTSESGDASIPKQPLGTVPPQDNVDTEGQEKVAGALEHSTGTLKSPESVRAEDAAPADAASGKGPALRKAASAAERQADTFSAQGVAPEVVPAEVSSAESAPVSAGDSSTESAPAPTTNSCTETVPASTDAKKVASESPAQVPPEATSAEAGEAPSVSVKQMSPEAAPAEASKARNDDGQGPRQGQHQAAQDQADAAMHHVDKEDDMYGGEHELDEQEGADTQAVKSADTEAAATRAIKTAAGEETQEKGNDEDEYDPEYEEYLERANATEALQEITVSDLLGGKRQEAPSGTQQPDARHESGNARHGTDGTHGGAVGGTDVDSRTAGSTEQQRQAATADAAGTGPDAANKSQEQVDSKRDEL